MLVRNFAVDFVERIDDVENAEDRRFLRVLMAGGVVAGRLVADDFHAAEQRLAVRTLEGPGSLVLGNLLERPLALVAMRAGLGFAVDRLADFRRVGRMGDPALFAQDPDTVDSLLIGHVVDDAVDIGRLVLQHREARALGDHFGDLDDLIGHLAEDLVCTKTRRPAPVNKSIAADSAIVR